ncbi:M16 family metallopeptidase [Deinococcus yavapaiensis]|uniref:Putative Zn-dependent peptidase n=1 Tax=Deinococcus yavapaiensis KR-236 TaxID=694435 RepID=A0A318SFW3_9DEIO|nr:pitrilysin family protein [Deinococcus yavapaiensis]PYE55766.1 putative Zn-dependent peptidase [Deinococcus yavapaiensis KR-236]
MFRLDVLESGLTILGEPNDAAQTVALGYFVRTGARDERLQEMGASHFIEHLLFKGSETVSGDDLNERFDRLGGNVNAFTSEETTVYHAACLPEAWEELLETLTELMRPAFRAADVEAERGVILEEIAMYEDNPASRAFDELRVSAWSPHPLGHLVLGTNETVSALTPEALRHNFEARYGTRNVTLVACGKFDWDALLRKTRELTATWPRTTFERVHAPRALTPNVTVVRDDALARTQFALIAPGLSATSPRREVGVVLADVLGGDNGRLYWSLVDTGLSDGVELAHVEFDELGAFEGGWSCDPERAKETLDVVRAELERAQREGVTEAEVRRSRKRIAVGLALRTETPYSRLFTLGMDFLYLGRPMASDEAIGRFEAVSVDAVNDLLKARPFDSAHVLALGPLATL